MKPKKDIQERLKITQLQNHTVRDQASVIKKMNTAEEHMEDTNTSQKVWHNILEVCQTSGKKQLGIKKRTKKSNNKHVQELSIEQKHATGNIDTQEQNQKKITTNRKELYSNSNTSTTKR